MHISVGLIQRKYASGIRIGKYTSVHLNLSENTLSLKSLNLNSSEKDSDNFEMRIDIVFGTIAGSAFARSGTELG